MILVDSSVWIDYFNGNDNPQTDFLDQVLGVEPAGLGDLMLAEVLQGFRSDKDYRTAKQLLLELPVCEIVGEERAIKAAENFRALRKKGTTIRKTTNALIATFCIQQNYPLLFTDKDFQPFVDHLGLRSALTNN